LDELELASWLQSAVNTLPLKGRTSFPEDENFLQGNAWHVSSASNIDECES